MRHLYEGLNSLTDQEALNNGYFTKNSMFVLNNEETYEGFMYDDPEVSQKLKE
jgi:hypothetical protein